VRERAHGGESGGKRARKRARESKIEWGNSKATERDRASEREITGDKYCRLALAKFYQTFLPQSSTKILQVKLLQHTAAQSRWSCCNTLQLLHHTTTHVRRVSYMCESHVTRIIHMYVWDICVHLLPCMRHVCGSVTWLIHNYDMCVDLLSRPSSCGDRGIWQQAHI